MRIFRITTLAHSPGALSGEGARRYGGRWNPKGLPMVYAAATRSLALLEMLVQDQPLRARHVFIPVDVPSRMRMTRLTHSDLPTDWRKPATRTRLQAIGRDWLARGDSAVLAVPSAVLPAEDIFLLNPGHTDFESLVPGAAEPLDTDSRLLRFG
jgi:RES domain-containing protein